MGKQVPQWESSRKKRVLELIRSRKYISELQGMGETIAVVDDPQIQRRLWHDCEIVYNHLIQVQCIILQSKKELKLEIATLLLSMMPHIVFLMDRYSFLCWCLTGHTVVIYQETLIPSISRKRQIFW